jgi:hypothetical protein
MTMEENRNARAGTSLPKVRVRTACVGGRNPYSTFTKAKTTVNTDGPMPLYYAEKATAGRSRT